MGRSLASIDIGSLASITDRNGESFELTDFNSSSLHNRNMVKYKTQLYHIFKNKYILYEFNTIFIYIFNKKFIYSLKILLFLVMMGAYH